MRSRSASLVLVTLLAVASRAGSAETVDPRELAPTLRAGDVAAVQARLDGLEANGARTREGWLALPRSLFALGVASCEDPAIGEALRAWVEAAPRSWHAQMIEGWRLLLRGVVPRADDRSLDYVELWGQPDPSLRAMARAAFERASGLAPRSSEPGAALLGVAVLDQLPLDERSRVFERACRTDRRCETARVVMLMALEPSLGGHAEELLSFARASGAEFPGDPNIGLLVGMAHRKVALSFGGELYFSQRGAFEEADRAYTRHLSAYPDALRHWNEYARIAAWSGRRDEARRAFERIGGNYVAPAWKSDYFDFRTRRAWALATDPTIARARLAP